MTTEYEEIMNETKRLKEMRAKYDAACNAYRDELLKQWELDGTYGFWNSDKPGTIYHYGETHNLTMEDIIYCVENFVNEDEVLTWEDYLLDANEFGFSLPNLSAWHKGCPRISEDTFNKLRKMKADLQQTIEEEKKKTGKPY